MKKIITFALLLCMGLSFTGCGLNYEKTSDVLGNVEEWTEKLGQTQITEDEGLIGERIFPKTPMPADTIRIVRMKMAILRRI